MTTTAPAVIDIEVIDHGSIVLLGAETNAAIAFFAEHIPEDAQYFAGRLAVEPRYVDDILAGAIEEGLTIG